MADPRLVLCGGLRPAAAPRRWWRAARVPLGIGPGAEVHLRVDQLVARMRTGVPALSADLLEVAAYVFAADQAVTRGGTAEVDYGDAWRVLLLPTAPGDAAPVRLRTPADVLALLEAETARVRADPTADPVARARAVGALARVALAAIEADQMTARVAALEAVLARRSPP